MLRVCCSLVYRACGARVSRVGAVKSCAYHASAAGAGPMRERYYPNTYGQSNTFNSADWRQGIEQSILESLREVQASYVALGQDAGLSSSGSVYVGGAGLAYTLWHVAQHVSRGVFNVPKSALLLRVDQAPAESAEAHPSRPVTATELNQVALAVCDESLQAVSRCAGRFTFLEGCCGPLALRCAVLTSLGRHQECRENVTDLIAYVRRATGELPDEECELLYGRAGLLYALLFVERTCPQAPVAIDLIQDLVRAVVTVGVRSAEAIRRRSTDSMGDIPHPCLLYVWHNSVYLGAAHGAVGVLHVLLMAMPHVQAMPDGRALAQCIEESALSLLAFRHPSGNLPSSLGSARDELIHWCHGAPGLAGMLAVLRATNGSEAANDALQRCLEVVWEKGLLKKGVGLCHGIAGNGYAFLAAYRGNGDESTLHRARVFGGFAAAMKDELLEVPDRPMSLYEGLAGAICFWSDLLDPTRSHFPGYELPAR